MAYNVFGGTLNPTLLYASQCTNQRGYRGSPSIVRLWIQLSVGTLPSNVTGQFSYTLVSCAFVMW